MRQVLNLVESGLCLVVFLLLLLFILLLILLFLSLTYINTLLVRPIDW